MSAEKKKTILLVEDEAITAMAEKMALEKYDYNVITTLSGEEAVTMVEKMPAIDLILMDINLGTGMDGTEAAALILKDHDLPVVFLSSHMEPEVVEKTEKITSYGYVVKESSITVLDASIKMAFKLFAAKINERKKESLMRESEGRYQAILEQAADAIFIHDKSGRILEVNRKACQSLGYSREELLLLSIADIDPEAIQTEKHKLWGKILAGEQALFESRQKRKDGSAIPVELTLGSVRLPAGLAVIGIVRDISKRKQAEASLEQALNWKQMIFEGSRDAIFISDQDSRFVAVNNSACDLTGYSREQLLKMRIPDIHDLPDLGAYKLYHQRIFVGEEILSEAKILRSDNAKIDTEFSNRCVSIAGKLYMHTTARDITERKEAEEEIKRQLQEKEILLREVHHRIKNNIASIGGLISLRLQSVTNPQAVAVLKDAFGRIDSMRLLYDKLLLSESYEDISVKKYLDDLIDTIVAIFPDNAKIKLEKRIADFQLDPKRLFPLGSIINELLTNTMKYAFINRDAGIIKISITNIGGHVTLNLQDNGSGLPDGFDINESKGFGLMLVKMLSQQLAGSFSMEDRAGTRCTVAFDI